MTRLIRRTLLALVLTALVGATFAPARAADPYGVDVLLSLTGAGAFLGQSEAKSLTAIVHTTAPSFVFSAGVSTKDLALAGMRYFREQGVRKIALRENASLQLVADEHFTPGDISISAQLVIAWVTGTPFGTVLKGAVDNDLGIPTSPTPAT